MSLYQQKQFNQVRKAIYQKYCNFLLADQDLIMRQVQLMQECKQKIQRRKALQTFNNISLNITSISSIQHMSSTDQSSFRNKFTQEFENSVLNAAIKDVKNNCTQQTFDTIMGYVMNNKIKQFQDLKRQMDKKVKDYQELSALIIIKQKDITFLQRDLSNVKSKEDFLEEQKKKVKKKNDLLDEKEKRLHNAQMSLLFKEKLNLQGKRRYQRQKQLFEQTKTQLMKVYNSLEVIWNKILENMQKGPKTCENPCWKQQVMKKCKEQLIQQRRILQQQQKQIQNQYQTMKQLSQQIKKVCININSDNKKDQQIKK